MSLYQLLLIAPVAVAPPPEPIPEIIVTGERQPRRLKDTAASVATFGGEDIDRLPAADRFESLLPLIPNVQLGSGGEAPTIRGQDTTGVVRDLPAFLGGTRPRTTLQIDGRPADYFELVFGLASLWDVDQVELFRSPQTITQGRNAIAGAIFITTVDPTFDWRARARAIGSTSGRSQLSAAAGGPLIDGLLAVRLSLDWGRDRPTSDVADRMVGADPDIDKQSLARIKLLARPAKWARIEAGYSRSRSQMVQIKGIRAPFRKRRDPDATYGVFGSWIDALTGEVSIDAAANLKSITTLTATRSRFTRYAPPGLGQAQVRKRVLTGEQLLRWQASTHLGILGGVHWLDEEIDQQIDISELTGIGEFRDRQGSLGLFGQAEWRLTPALQFSAAVRFQRDTQRRRGAIVGRGAPATLDYDGHFDAWMPKLSISWSPNDRWTLGAFTQKAYNPGGATLLLNGVTDSFDAETLWDHEMFVRGSTSEKRLRWSANLFFQKFRNAQRPQTEFIERPDAPPLPFSSLANAPRARSRGVEGEVHWRTSRRVEVKAGFGVLDTRITRTIEPGDPIADKRFQRAPRLSASASIDWRPADFLTLSVQGRGNSGYFSDDANTSPRRISAGALFDAKVSYDLGRARLSGYVRNLTDRFQLTYLFSPTFATAADPREFGIELDGRF